MSKRDKLEQGIRDKKDKIKALEQAIKDDEAEIKKLDMIEAYGFKKAIEATGIDSDTILAAIKSGDPQRLIAAMQPIREESYQINSGNIEYPRRD